MVSTTDSPTPAPTTSDMLPNTDINTQEKLAPNVPQVVEKIDIEHVAVQDDPRKWSNIRKVRFFESVLMNVSPMTMSSECYFDDCSGCFHDRRTWGQYTKS